MDNVPGSRRADLQPALGYPGGPCHVIQRIQEEVRNPRLRDQLVQEVQEGDDLSNPEAAQVYDLEQERGAGFARRIVIGPHAQYRMDLRGVTVPQVRAALKEFTKKLNDWKAQRHPSYTQITQDLSYGESVQFTDHMGLTIVFAVHARDTVKLVTTYYKGERDPKMPSNGCRIRYSYDRRAATTPLPASFPESEIGLMTQDEFLKFKNPKNKHHPSDSYDTDLMKLNRDYPSFVGDLGHGGDEFSVSRFSRGLQVTHDGEVVGVIHNGTLYYDNPSMKSRIPGSVFERSGDQPRVDLGINRRKQVKYLSEVMPLISPTAKLNEQRFPVILQRIKVRGEYMTIRAEKKPEKNRQYTLAIFNSEGWVVAQASDEWGATLIMVAREYRSQGLGKILGRYWYEINPDSTSGGFTESGERNAIALWKERVREFSSRGWYTDLIKRGDLTYARVKEILKDVGQRPPPRKEVEDTSVKPTGDIRVLVDDDISFVVYDSAFLQEQDEKFIHGFGFFRDSHPVGTFLYRIEYDRPYAEFTTKVALQLARDQGEKIYVGEGYGDMVEWKGIPGIEREGDYLVSTRAFLPLRRLAAKERRLRKAVDPYDEIYYQLLEMADAKW